MKAKKMSIMKVNTKEDIKIFIQYIDKNLISFLSQNELNGIITMFSNTINIDTIHLLFEYIRENIFKLNMYYKYLINILLLLIKFLDYINKSLYDNDFIDNKFRYSAIIKGIYLNVLLKKFIEYLNNNNTVIKYDNNFFDKYKNKHIKISYIYNGIFTKYIFFDTIKRYIDIDSTINYETYFSEKKDTNIYINDAIIKFLEKVDLKSSIPKKLIIIKDFNYDYVYCKSKEDINEFIHYIELVLKNYIIESFSKLSIDNDNIFLNNIILLFKNFSVVSIEMLETLIIIIDYINTLLYKEDNIDNILLHGVRINKLLKQLIEYLNTKQMNFSYYKHLNDDKSLEKLTFETKDHLYAYILKLDKNINFSNYNEEKIIKIIKYNIHSFNKYFLTESVKYEDISKFITFNKKIFIYKDESVDINIFLTMLKSSLKKYFHNVINIELHIKSLFLLNPDETLWNNIVFINNILLFIDYIIKNKKENLEKIIEFLYLILNFIKLIIIYLLLVNYGNDDTEKYNYIIDGIENIQLIETLVDYLLNIDKKGNIITYKKYSVVNKEIYTCKNIEEFFEYIYNKYRFNLKFSDETKSILKLNKEILDNIIYDYDKKLSNFIKNDNGTIILSGGGNNKYKKTDKKITIIYKKKQYTRNIYICERKKYIKINKSFMLLSKLKKI